MLLEDSKLIDEKESQSLISLDEELRNQKKLRKKITNLLNEFKDEERVNGTDPECKRMNGRQGSHAGYNVQSTTDEAYGLIVSLEGSNSRNDLNELSKQIEIAEETLEKKCEIVCADAGYSSMKDLVSLDKAGKTVVVPTAKQVKKDKTENPFSKEKFTYYPNQDIYKCPEAKELYRTTKKERSKGLNTE